MLTEAIVGAEETHGVLLAGVAEPDNCEVLPAQANKVPEMVGKEFIVNVLESDVVPHSFITDSVTVCEPGKAKLTATPEKSAVEVAGIPPEKPQE